MYNSNLFGEIESLSVSIEAAAREVGVSTATIRNWIKTGYLENSSKGHVTQMSLSRLLNEVVGKEKLHSRANKGQKDSHNHGDLTAEIFDKVCLEAVDGDSLWQVYEGSLSDSYRNKEGIYYTPANIVSDMLAGLPQNLEDKLFLDPCCGGGNFIVHAIGLGFKPENIFGFDTDENAIAITRKRIFERTGYQSDNIVLGDFLAGARNLNRTFDYIFTNPPWGKKIPKEKKESYGRMYKTGKSVDTSSLFFFASLACLSEGGKLGFLLPESFFNISTFQDARNAAMTHCIEKFIDYGKPFKGLVTKAQAIVLSNKKEGQADFLIECITPESKHSRTYESFESAPKSIFNFWLDQTSSELVTHVYRKNHITLEGNAEWGLGIVTGNNEKFCSATQKEGYIPVFKGADITKNGLKEAAAFIPDNLNFYQQVAPKSLYEAPEKLIYKFISSNLCFYFDTERRYILNSANMLVTNMEFPLGGGQLTALLNSDFVNWLFRSVFNTHKILRGDLEMLPIYVDYFRIHPAFEESSFLGFLGIKKTEHGAYRIEK